MWRAIILVPTIAVASAGFSPKQRAEAETFIKGIFVQMRHDRLVIIRKCNEAIEAEDRSAVHLLKQPQIDFRALRKLEKRRSKFEKKLTEATLYVHSLERPAEKISSWEESREESALTLLACVELMPEWQLYQDDPSNIQLYEQLHDKMRDVALSLAPTKDEQSFRAYL